MGGELGAAIWVFRAKPIIGKIWLDPSDGSLAKLTLMTRIVREMIQEVVGWPLPFKLGVGLAIAAIFIVVTQWEHLHLDVAWDRLTAKQPAAATTVVTPRKSEQRPFDFPATPLADQTQAAAVEAAPALIVTPASAISADLAKKCRAMAIKAHPPQLAGTKKGSAQAERTFYKQCITNDGAPPNDGTQNNAAPQSK